MRLAICIARQVEQALAEKVIFSLPVPIEAHEVEQGALARERRTSPVDLVPLWHDRLHAGLRAPHVLARELRLWAPHVDVAVRVRGARVVGREQIRPVEELERQIVRRVLARHGADALDHLRATSEDLEDLAVALPVPAHPLAHAIRVPRD